VKIFSNAARFKLPGANRLVGFINLELAVKDWQRNLAPDGLGEIAPVDYIVAGEYAILDKIVIRLNLARSTVVLVSDTDGTIWAKSVIGVITN